MLSSFNGKQLRCTSCKKAYSTEAVISFDQPTMSVPYDTVTINAGLKYPSQETHSPTPALLMMN